MRRKEDRVIPLKAVFHRFRARAHRIVGIDVDRAQLFRAVIVARQIAAVTSRKNNVGIFRMRRDPARFAAADIIPMRLVDAEIRRSARNFDGRIVLLCAVNIVWKIIIDRDAVKLRGRLILFRPIFPAVK